MILRPHGRLATAAVGVGLCAGLAAMGAGCGGADRDAGDDTLVVFAASSLTDAFAQIEAAFERERPGVDVVVNTGGSSSLAAQIDQGAPADVFAAADERTAALVADRSGADPVVFARNRLAIAVAAGNPHGITSLVDLGRDELAVVVAAPEVPAGAYARAAADRLGVDLAPDSLEQSVRAVAAKVRLGEADAGVVYRTDIAGDDRLELIAIESTADDAIVADYPIVAVEPSRLARDFVAFVTGPDGRELLVDAGFEVP